MGDLARVGRLEVSMALLLLACGSTEKSSTGDGASNAVSTSAGGTSGNAETGGAETTASSDSGGSSTATGGEVTTSGGSASGGASTSNTNGGTTSDGGTSGSGGAPNEDLVPRPDPATATEFEACVFYLRTQCNKRFAECLGGDPVAVPCPDFDYLCPDYLFADGSQYTVTEVIECADVWQQASCDDIVKNVFPICGLPTPARAAGEPCVFSSQCASRACHTRIPHPDLPECGTCASVVGEGEDCTGSPQTCDEGLECTGAGCQVSVEFGLPAGAECERYGQCAPPNFCFTFPGQDSATCQAVPEVGEECPTDIAVCAADGYCSDGLCVPDVALGDPCEVSTACPGEALCEEGVCVPAHGLGEPCSPVDRSFTRAQCATGTLCMCSDADCTAAGVCVIRRDAGEACGEENVVCIPGTACQDGVCVITGSQGLADACPAQL